MYKNKLLTCILLLFVMVAMFAPVPVTHAAGLDSVLSAATAPTSSTNGGGLLSLLGMLLEKILGPILNVFSGGDHAATTNPPVKITPQPGNNGSIVDAGVLRGKTIVVDPGHGGSNPGAVGNDTREADNNLAVSQKLRDKLVQAGARVILTRNSDRTVAAEGNSLGEELQARLDIAENNHADIFVSIHSNSNPDSSIAGAMTFYPSGKSPKLALEVQSALIQATQSTDKGTSPATFYVLRNAAMPSILVEMGFVTNPAEAARLHDNSYREQIAQGIFTGIAKYFQNA